MADAARGREDVAGDVRSGEALDGAKVTAWLKERVPGLSGDARVTQYSGGASNWTYRLEYPSHDLILRRPPAGTKAKSAHDMGREVRIQTALRPVFPVVPEILAHCTDESVIGADFYVMRRIAGLIPRKELGFPLDRASTRRLCETFVDTLVALHKVDVSTPGCEALAAMNKGPGYCQRQIDGWSERYTKARTWNVPTFARTIAWLKERVPADVRTCAIHGDFRFDNLVLDANDPQKIIGVLDWELATVGDPLMDLGSALAYWVQADDDAIMRSLRRQPTHVPGMLTRGEVIERYCAAMGISLESFAFYEVFGLFRLAGIVQQIYFRYFHKQTRNPRFKNFWLVVHYLAWRSSRIVRAAP